MAKRRANGEGNIRKRKDGRWEGRYTAGFDSETGKQIFKSVLGKSQADVKEKLKKAMEDTKGIDIKRSGEYTVAEWLKTWFEIYSKPNIRESTSRYYKGFMDLHIIPRLGDIRLNKLTAMDVQKFYNDLKRTGRIRKAQKEKTPGLSSTFVRGVHMVLHNSLEQAVKERLIIANPTDVCKIPSLEKTEMKVLKPEHVGVYLKAAEDRGLLPIFYLELTSGMRKGELVALLWTDLDTEKNTVSVTKQAYVVDGKIQILKPKTKTSIRRISIPQQAVDLLIQEHEKHPDNPYMFPSPITDTMYYPDSIVNQHKKILKDASLEHIRFHDLRHTFATLALQNGVDVKTVSSMLGHYSAGFTLDTYTHVTEKMQEEAAEKMGLFMTQSM